MGPQPGHPPERGVWGAATPREENKGGMSIGSRAPVLLIHTYMWICWRMCADLLSSNIGI